MAAGSITHNVGTNFTVSGIRSALSDFRRLAGGFRDRMQSMRQAAAAASKAIVDRLKQITAFSWSKLQAGAKKAFDVIKLGALGVVAAIGGISTAAIHSTKELSELFNLVDKQSKSLGMSPEDVSALRFTLEQNGVEADEILPNLSTMIFEFKAIKDAIDDADESWAKTASWNLKEALATGTADAVFAARDGNRAAAATSFAGIEFRQNQIRQQIGASAKGQDGYRLELVKEYKQLSTAKDALEASFGPVGMALFKLRDAGLDLDRAMKPGMDSLYAVAEAFQRVTDPAEKLTISMGIFGGDAGAKMIPVLEQGRVGIENYRRELERLGGVVTSRDAELAHQYQESTRRRNMSIQGARAVVFRELSPDMTAVNDQFTEFLVANRERIADIAKYAFGVLKNLATDAMAFFEGKRSGFASGWINSLIDGFQRVKTIALDMVSEVKKAFAGQNSRFDFLNAFAYGIQQATAFAVDLFKVLSGGSAETFRWLNDLKAGFDEFSRRLKEAWDLFKGVLDTLHSMIKPVLDWLNIDPLTAVLFVGMLRLSGLLGGIGLAIRGLATGFTGLLGIGAGGGALAAGLGVVAAAAIAMKVAYDKMQESYDRTLAYTTESVRIKADQAFEPRHKWLLKNDERYAYRYWQGKGETWMQNPDVPLERRMQGKIDVGALRAASAERQKMDAIIAARAQRPSETVRVELVGPNGQSGSGMVDRAAADLLRELNSGKR